MWRWSGIVAGSLVVGSTVAIYAFALPYRFNPQWLGPYTLRYAGPIPVYQPWAVYRLGWAYWQRDGALPRPMQTAAWLGGLAGVLCGMGLVRCQAPQAQGASFATRRQIKALGLYSPVGVVLGKAYGRVLRMPVRAHMLWVALTQSGKSSLLLCTLLDEVWCSVVVHDPKDELREKTEDWRAQGSRVLHLAPTHETSDGYNVLGHLRYGTVHAYQDADAVAAILCEPGDVHQGRSDTGQHFLDLTRQLLVGGMLAGHVHGADTLPAVATFLQEELAEGCLRLLADPAGQTIGRQVAAMKDNLLGSLHSTLGRVLAIYADPLVARTVSRTDFTLADLREASLPTTIYLHVPFKHQDRLQAWKRLVLTQMLTWCTRPEGRYQHELLLAIDEFPSLGRSQPLMDAPNYVAGSGVRLLYITPSLNALTGIYGLYNPIREGCRYTLVFAPSDPRVARDFADATGEKVTERERISKSWGAGDWVARKTVSTDERRSPLVSATDLMQLSRKEALLLVGGARDGEAIRIKVRKVWQGQRPWKGRVQG